jgi:hypothetical protein
MSVETLTDTLDPRITPIYLARLVYENYSLSHQSLAYQVSDCLGLGGPGLLIPAYSRSEPYWRFKLYENANSIEECVARCRGGNEL